MEGVAAAKPHLSDGLGYEWGGTLAKGKAAVVYFMKRNSVMHAIKELAMAKPSDLANKQYRECLVMLSLNTLADSGKCPNFSYLHNYFKATAAFDYGLSKAFGKRFLYLMMEYSPFVLRQDIGHAPVEDIGAAMSEREFRSITFQITYALYVAQKELGFTHGDMHHKNVRLQPLANNITYMVYGDGNDDGDGVWYVPGRFKVKITDFGNAHVGQLVDTTDMNEIIKPSDLGKVEVDETDVSKEFRSHRNAFNSAVREIGTTMRQLVHRAELFAPLKQRPSDFDPARAEYWHSGGEAEVQALRQRVREGGGGGVP